MAEAEQKVLRWAGLARRAEQETGVSANLLLGLIEIESGGDENSTSPVGAKGLTQFMPATATEYGVNTAPGHAWSQILGAAKYLKALGVDKSPADALARYNAGPAAGFRQRAGKYPDMVLSAAKKYTGVSATPAAAGDRTRDTPPTSAPASSSTGLFGADVRSGAVRALLWTLLVAAGVSLAVLGAGRAAGLGAPA